MDTNKQLRKSNNKMLAGVAGGVAEYAGVDPTLVRLAFVLLTLAGGPGLILYIILALVMPQPA
jgi:phage shock protein PspC (stress-responsive transcriptional regulator)